MIAIHDRPGSFSDRWIRYCKEKNIEFKIVNCYDTNIIKQLRDSEGLMWHWAQWDAKAIRFARQLTYSLEIIGIKVFPNSNTCWHFDDKIGQKYLLESINAPLVPTHIFYDKRNAYNWIRSAEFPKVFKLRGGAGSANVKLVKTKSKARSITRKSFNKGFPYDSWKSSMKQRLWVLQRDKNIVSMVYVLNGLVRLVIKRPGMDLLPRQKGYVYFQDFIPNNDFDDRIVVIGNRAFALRRSVRKKDFRASGSGLLTYEPDLFKKETIKISLNISKKLNTQSIAFDFVYDENNDPKIIEISYAYAMGATYDDCPGYWDKNLHWHDETVNPQYFMIEDFIETLES